jgi:hypothetical protein
MHQVSVRGELLSIPTVCCCCCNPKAKQRYRVAASRVGRVVDKHYTDKRWTHFLICKRCHQWVKANRTAARWFPQFLAAFGIAIITGILAVLGHLDTTTGKVWGIIALVTLVYGALGLTLWVLGQSKARKLDPGPPCHPRPVVLVDWLRNKYTFEFSNEDYYNAFRTLNESGLC